VNSRSRWAAMATALILGCATPPHAQAAKPAGRMQCPADTQTFSPPTSAALQTALDCATPGATITLAAGLVYEGNFTLRYKAVSDPEGTPARITIRSDAFQALVDKRPERVAPADELFMAALRLPPRSTAPVLSTELKTLPDGTRRAASHYQLVGIKFVSDHWVNHLVQLGTGTETVISELPLDITFDRSYFAGSAGEGTKKGLLANGRHIVVANSYFKDFKDTANDAQAIAMWNGAGPLQVLNNYLEGSGENMMVGGGDPTIAGLVPSDITIRGNYFFKPPAWTQEVSTQKGSQGKQWRVKNLFELKNAERVVFDGNVLENNWIQADQQGFAILLSPRNQNGGCPWCRIQQVTISNNVIKNSIAGMKFLATDDLHPSGQLRDIVVRNNLLVNINGDAIPGTNPGDRAGRLFQIMNPYPSTSGAAAPTGPIDLVVDHNTGFSTREFSFSTWDPVSGVRFTNNVARHNPCSTATSNDCGISGNGTPPGSETFSAWFMDGLEIAGNILFDAGRDRRDEYAPFTDNAFPELVIFKSSLDGSSPVDLITGTSPASDGSDAPDYTVVTADGVEVRSTDGKRVGADWDVLKTTIDAAMSGTALP
jgi:hypothetical protein